MARLSNDELVQAIMADIRRGELADAHRKLPAEPELMARYDVTRYALRQALQALGTMGYTYQMHGVGTFVRTQQAGDSIALEHSGGLSAEAARIGRQLTTATASKRECRVDQAEFRPNNYQFEPDERLLALERFRAMDQQPYVVEHSYYLKSVIEEIPDSALYGSLFEFCEAQQHIKIGFIDQIIMSEPLPKVAADYLQLPVGAPCLVVQDETYLSTGQLLAFSKQYYDYRQAKMFMVKKIH
ncbi:transcriptional regulator [Lactobacillus pentosus] [Lactiplantibacillus mudanjiangensis]|uniref:GntR family transcriptional regulator n=1 Tax=Lactiplantibacillus mudanjiangensis TaxID=1296538 RepID=UPI00101567B1|nr:GntR family transcriptional regulator [Lactiplantibacillus mudanjiangensis]VDG21196.1 transcriptional regulator [Lactobacillus pentosus] [Lactiplantibacillus mudanjiangensis]VDG31799.1 transcriptional regulator [Lactobacillus pentosus] [Lactiplantibacillus mudanjiangensis]